MLQDQGEYHFHVQEDRANEWRWHLKAANGRIVADSGEGYTRQADCVRAMAMFRGRVGNAKVTVHPTPQEKVAQALLARKTTKSLLGL